MSEIATRMIKPHHLEREACLYVRQSSPRQVEENIESGHRQYGLSRKAMALGWPAECIRVIDDDQGKSGAYSTNRSGFRDLMARIAAAEVGIVLGLEVSRLARDNADWQQLLRIASITNTLILDETGVYDPNDTNDKLLLNMKGTISEFELQGIMARLLGGQRSAAARGALKIPLPIGLAYDHTDVVVFDPDQSIVDAIGQVFESFRRRRSAMAVVKWMHREEILLPSRPLSGPTRGELRWALPSFAQVARILKNPRYAGAFVYGRSRMQRLSDGTGKVKVVPMDEWQVFIPDAHVGYIDWEEYRRNTDTMASNARAFFGTGLRTAAPREGAALLQSRVLCGHCGRRMGLQYTAARPSRGAAACHDYLCKEPLVRYGRQTCQRVRGDLVDAEISRFVIDVMNHKNIDLALAVQEQVNAEFAEADAQRVRRIERIRYEADMARRRFFEVDPANRLVAAALEANWNERLRDLEEACREREDRAAVRDSELSQRQVERIRELTRDFGQVWNASETANTDRKRLLGHLIEDATLTRNGYEVTIELRMRGGRSLTLETLHLPRPIAKIRKTAPETIAALDKLLNTHTDEAAARELNRMGHRNWKGEPYTAKRLRGTRIVYGLPSYRQREMKRLRDEGFSSAGEVAEQLGLDPGTVRALGRARDDTRVQRKIITTDRRRYCMYRANCDSETVRQTCQGKAEAAASSSTIPKSEQGAS